MIRKLVIGFALSATLIIAVALTTFGGGTTVQAHERGHGDGCKAFGQWVSGELAGPWFGVLHQAVAPRNPGIIAQNVNEVGHDMCDN